MAYQGLEAYKALQRVSAGGCRWGGQGWDCWMGILGEGVMGRVARGVPECFVTGRVVRKVEKAEVKSEVGVPDVAPPIASVASVAPMAVVATPAPSALPAEAAP
jgi:vacuolar protein sorting-associated protein 72